jgi:hypothetical protein
MDFDGEDINTLVDRMRAAGWITGDSCVTAQEFKIIYSAKVTYKMIKLVDLFILYFPASFGLSPRTLEASDRIKFLLKAITIAPELSFRGLTLRESNALTAIMFAYFKKHTQGGDNPRT